MSDNLSIGISIIVEDTMQTYHTLEDWGLALGNNNYIGDPEMETTYITVPGRDGLIAGSTKSGSLRLNWAVYVRALIGMVSFLTSETPSMAGYAG